MKFQKVNDNVIRCIISQEEMNEKGVKIDDLMDNRSKAEEFLRGILQEAREKLDFQTSGEALNVQLSIMKDGDVLLMISDDQNAVIRTMLDQLKDRLKDFQSEMDVAVQKRREAKEKDKNQTPALPPTADKSATVEVAPTKLPAGGTNREDIYSATKAILEDAKDSDPLSLNVWAEIGSIDNCMTLAKTLFLQGDVASELYKLDEIYYLHIDMVQTKSEIAHNVFALAEYSSRLYLDDTNVYGVEEHGDCLIAENAVKVLSEL